MSQGEIVNKVAQSPLITFNLEDYLPSRKEDLDLSTFLEGGFILREKAFREAIAGLDFPSLTGAVVRIFCSTDAILPAWAPLLVASRLIDYGITSYWANSDEAFWSAFYQKALAKVDWNKFEGRPVIIKGCGDRRIPQDAYLCATQNLKPLAKKISYGEACSAVPLK
ncbi:MAG: hypothetical protein RL754_820 [Bacteroidota bacterium]|jgi:hypothetical protein